MKFLIPLAFLLVSCSQQFHCKRCLSGGNVIRDTLTVHDTIRTPGEEAKASFDKRPVNWDSLRNANPDMFESPPCPELPPVMEVKKGKASAKITQTDKGLDVQVKCEADTLYLEKKIPIPVEVKVGVPTGYAILMVIGALLLGAFVMKLFG